MGNSNNTTPKLKVMYNTIQDQINLIQSLKANVIVDVAGKDSYAALTKYLEENDNRDIKIFPIVVNAPSQYGSHEALSASGGQRSGTMKTKHEKKMTIKIQK